MGSLGFVEIIIVIFGILQIILFFKVWAMTNNVREIKKKIIQPDLTKDAKLAAIKGDKTLAKSLLDTSFYLSVIEISEASETSYPASYVRLIEKYGALYEQLKLESPDFAKFEDGINY